MNRLVSELKKWNIELSDKQLSQFNRYYELLIEWNERINLTSITDKDEVIDKHFIDSIALCNYRNLNDKKLIDIGSGAGFPGIPLKIICPNCNITLLDSLQKRINFLNIVIDDLNLDKIKAVHYRSEDAGHDNLYREKYNIVTCRAVANLRTLSEYCLPFTSLGGEFIPYKSGNIDEELDSSKKAITILGGRLKEVIKYSPLDTQLDRSLVVIKKEKTTPKKYPRKAGTPSKQPI